MDVFYHIEDDTCQRKDRKFSSGKDYQHFLNRHQESTDAKKSQLESWRKFYLNCMSCKFASKTFTSK